MMLRRSILAALFGALLPFAAASAQTIIGTLPFTLQNGSVADANQVMSDFNTIVSSVNANAASAGANSNITALNGLTTPLSYTAGGSSIYIGGASSGSSNAYVVASPIPAGFTLVTGKVVSFIANFSNTGPTTLAVNGLAATNLFRQTPSGPVAMVGGEVVNGLEVWAQYDGTEFQCLNCTLPALVPTGTIADFGGVTVPAGWTLANGSAVSRTTFSSLFNATAFTSVSATTNSNTTVNITGANTFIQVGWFVGGSNVTCNSTVTAVAANSITISAAAGATGATTLTIGPYPQGDCSTTFNLPNFTGRLTAGVDGTTNITSATCTNAGSLGTTCGAQTQTLTLAQLPAITSTNLAQAITVYPGGNSSVNVAYTGGSVTNGALTVGGGGNVPVTGTSWTGVTAFSNNNSISVVSTGTSGNSHPILDPVGLVYKIVKL